MLTSPIPPPTRQINSSRWSNFGAQQENDGSSSDDAFEPVAKRSVRVGKRKNQDLGPPITSDDMTKLSETHAICVNDFVEAAKTREEKIRNQRGLRAALFTISEFRQMAINWTTSKREMLRIPGISAEKVELWGDKFIPLIKQAHQDYEAMVHSDRDLDMDANHRNVIDLVSDEEMQHRNFRGEDENQDENDFDDDDDNVSLTEEPSKYFPPPHIAAFNEKVAQAQAIPQTYQPKPAQSKKDSGGSSSSRGKFRGGKKLGGRRSTGSKSGSGAGSSRSGISKRGQGRRTSASFKKSSTSRGSSASNGSLPGHFGNQSGGGFGGGIGVMPT
jgi:bloom syndrome protein